MAGAAQEQWSSRWGFLLAAIGGAVGLGNIWRFPYITGKYGGGAFVLIYVLAVVLIAIPILIGELQLGKRGHKDPITGTRMVAEAAGRSPRWSIIGWLGVGAAFFVLTYYAVIAGQVLDYFWTSVTGGLSGVTEEVARTEYDKQIGNPGRMFFWHSVIMVITIAIVARGITGGIEKAAKIMMPTFFVMLIGMLIYAMILGDFARGWDYMFNVDFSKITAEAVLVAIGQAFFSIGIGFGYMLAYGAFLPDDISIPRTSVIISFADTAVAIIAGLVIFPLVYAYGQEPGQGPELIFRILPVVFSQMNFGAVVGGIFFLLLTFAALTSCIAILQPAVSYLEESHGMGVKKATLVAGGTVWILGLASVLSVNIWAGFYPLSMFETFETSTVTGIIDFFTANYMMLGGGILIAIFTGWQFKEGWARSEFGENEGLIYTAWLWLARVFAPAAVAIALFTQLMA